jgi:hypothetical protein
MLQKKELHIEEPNLEAIRSWGISHGPITWHEATSGDSWLHRCHVVMHTQNICHVFCAVHHSNLANRRKCQKEVFFMSSLYFYQAVYQSSFTTVSTATSQGPSQVNSRKPVSWNNDLHCYIPFALKWKGILSKIDRHIETETVKQRDGDIKTV